MHASYFIEIHGRKLAKTTRSAIKGHLTTWNAFQSCQMLPQQSFEKICLKISWYHDSKMNHWFLFRLTRCIPKTKLIVSVMLVKNDVSCLSIVPLLYRYFLVKHLPCQTSFCFNFPVSAETNWMWSGQKLMSSKPALRLFLQVISPIQVLFL